MLLQGDEKEMVLLPAIPDAWKEGKVTGLRARGGYTVDLEWFDGKLLSATITADNKGKIKLSHKGKQITLKVKKGETRLVRFNNVP